MRVVKLFHQLMAAAALVVAPVVAQAQTVAPQPGCKSTPAELDANKKVAMEFFRPGADRVALADPTYKQHNPAVEQRRTQRRRRCVRATWPGGSGRVAPSAAPPRSRRRRGPVGQVRPRSAPLRPPATRSRS